MTFDPHGHANGVLDTSAAAAAFLDRRFWPVPVKPGTKKPAGGKGWNAYRADPADLTPFRDRGIGLLLGAPSGGLIDVDLDGPEALAVAPALLPFTDMVSGRRSAPRSHWWYRCADAPDRESEEFLDPLPQPDDRRMLVEFRSTGGQTMVPPSVHPGGEPLAWDRDGEPTALPAADLRAAVRAVAAAALLARYWPGPGARHHAHLALGGGLLRCGWTVARVETFVGAVARATGDGEARDRVRDVAGTADKIGADEPATGWPKLAALLGPSGRAVVDRVGEWLGVPVRAGSPPGHSAAAQAGPQYVPLPPWEPFPTDALPDPWASLIRQGAAAIGCDEAYLALPALAVIASAVGNSRQIALKGGWAEPAIVWAAVVGESGTHKSPAAGVALGVLKDRQGELIRRYKAELPAYAAALAEYKGRKAAGDGDDPGDRPTPPVLKRLICSDVTIERLAGILQENPRGVLVARDELAGWLGSFTRYKGKGGGTDVPNWLELQQAGTVTVDRKTGDVKLVHVPHAAASVCGGIQPGVLSALMTRDFFESGLTARILVAYPPRRPKVWTETEVHPDTLAAVGRNLDALLALELGADPDGAVRPVRVGLTPAAKAAWVEFYNWWGRVQEQTSGALAAAFAKLEAYAARFALLHHVAERVEGGADRDAVTDASVAAGVRLVKWFRREAERVYALLGESEDTTEFRTLVDLVRRLAVRNDGRVTVAKLQNANSRKYPTRDAAEDALTQLVVGGLGRWEDGPRPARGGRQSRYFVPCPTSDVSDDRFDEPEDGNGGASDDRPGTSDDRDPGGLPASAASDLSPSSCESIPHGCANRSSETSDVGRGIWPPIALRSPEVNGESIIGRESPIIGRDRCSRVSDQAGLESLLDALRNHAGPVGLDTETTGLDPETDRVRLIQVATPEAVFLVDLFALTDPAALPPLFDALATVEVVGHNLQFDLRFLARLGFAPGPVFDTMLASAVLHAGHKEPTGGRVRHALRDVARRELGVDLAKDLQTSDWGGRLTPAQLGYAAADARVLLPLAADLRAKLAAADLTATADREMRAVRGIAWAAPIAVDRDRWLGIARAAAADVARLAEEMDAAAPNPASLPGMESRNWNSPAEVKAALAAVGVALTRTDDDALAAVDHPLAGLVRDYRAAHKRTGTYGAEWVAKYAPDGRVCPSWRPLGAESGRMSCSDPNLQQIPRGADYRGCFVARPGTVLVKADYSQIELRIAAAVSGDAAMLAAYRGGKDLHALTAAAVLGKPAGDVTKGDRQLAKAVNFGLLFGMGWKTLRAYARANYGVELTDAAAQSYRAAFFRAYPGLRAWHAREGDRVRGLFRADPAGTFEVRTRGGRRRVLPVGKKRAGEGGYPNVTEALNTPVQGTGADGLKAGIALLWDRRADCPGAVPVLFCHDEVVVEVRAAEADNAVAWVRACLIDAMAPLVDPVPVAVDVTVGRTWGGD